MGFFADAGGAHFASGCFIISSVNNSIGVPLNWTWLILAGTWSFIWGLRGILWHQYYDKENDIASGVKTLAINLSDKDLKKNRNCTNGFGDYFICANVINYWQMGRFGYFCFLT